jgi:AcrR family transcriptional regulator
MNDTTLADAGPPAEATLSTQDWIDAARRMLIRDGVGALKIDRLAKECNVTRGGFYWRFKSREDLLAKLLEEWRRVNTSPMLEVFKDAGSPAQRLRDAAELWIREEEFDPMFDTAVRAWAATSTQAAAVVKEVDEIRIQAFRDVFVEAGYSDIEALVRARIFYFHQVGYYTLGLNESTERRHDLFEHYYRALTGLDWDQTHPSTSRARSSD